MGNRWRKLAVFLLVVVCLLQSVHSVRSNDSVCMQETAGENKATANKRSGGGGGHGGGHGGGSSGHGGGSSGHGNGERGSGGTSKTPDGRLIPLIAGGLATPKGGHHRHNAASSTYKCSLPILLTTTALGSIFLAL